MSTELLEAHGLYVTRYAGPATQGEDRVRYQFTIPGEYMSVDRSGLSDLLSQLESALADEFVDASCGVSGVPPEPATFDDPKPLTRRPA